MFGSGSHAGVAVDWPGSKWPKEFDFGPEDGSSSDSMWPCGVIGQVMRPSPMNPFSPQAPRSHPGDPPNAVVRVPSTPAQDKMLRQWLLPTVTDNKNDDWWGPGTYGNYQFPLHQCSTYVSDALFNSGLKQNGFGSPIVTPLDLLNWAKKQKGAKTTFDN